MRSHTVLDARTREMAALHSLGGVGKTFNATPFGGGRHLMKLSRNPSPSFGCAQDRLCVPPLPQLRERGDTAIWGIPPDPRKPDMSAWTSSEGDLG